MTFVECATKLQKLCKGTGGVFGLYVREGVPILAIKDGQFSASELETITRLLRELEVAEERGERE